MARNTFKKNDDFTASPMLTLLPVLSQVNKLEELTNFFYARYEKIAAMKGGLESQSASSTHFNAELAMLKEVLHWLGIDPGSFSLEDTDAT